MSLQINELALWDGTSAFLIDGGPGAPERPAVHLQAGGGGYLRLVGPSGPLLWALVDPGWYAVDIVRAPGARCDVLPPIRAEMVEQAPGTTRSRDFISWWTRRFTEWLCESTVSTLAAGRRSVVAAMESIETSPQSTRPQYWHQNKWHNLVLGPKRLPALLAQSRSFTFSWDTPYIGLLLSHELSPADDGRVKMWRKRARDGRLPPLLAWWCRGLYAHVLLDGHDRAHAAMLEGVVPDIVVVADVTAHSRDDVEQRRQTAIDQTALLDSIPTMKDRPAATNSVLRGAWDPRVEWDLATPGFPLDGGVEPWEREIRGTILEAELARRQDQPAPPDRSDDDDA